MAIFATHALSERALIMVTTFTNYCKICYMDAYGCFSDGEEWYRVKKKSLYLPSSTIVHVCESGLECLLVCLYRSTGGKLRVCAQDVCKRSLI